uniref:J domain-containing protein n=1 Tax=Tetradesmus obliquus TaxID=3088 RepID=A0A383VEZ3_TETOB|eukprot:jgi/Sobl393_1/12297/SZX63234.1
MFTYAHRGGTSRPGAQAAARQHGCAAAAPGVRQPSSSRLSVVAAASKTPDYYDVLGVDVDASEEDIRAAYRKRAKQLHPDVNKEDDAEQQFKQAKLAYETLVDADSRRQYDQTHRTRRLNFFQDVEEDEGLPGAWQPPKTVDPWEVHRKMWEAEEQQAASSSGREDTGDASQQQQLSPEEMLERLSRVMGGQYGSPMRQWGSGRLDPFGSGSSEAWHRRVEEQTRDPGFGYRGRSMYGSGDNDEWGGAGPSEWDPYRPGDDAFEKRQGWSNPGRQEWQNPRRRWEEEGDEGLGGGRGSGPSRRGGGGFPGGGGFRGKPL